MICAGDYFQMSLLIALMLMLTTCRKQNIVEEISRDESRILGEVIADAIKANPTDFPLVVRNCNEKAYQYIDSLYSLASNGMKYRRYPGNNNWSRQRVWRFNIINKEEVMAFCIPGGDFYITKGLLKKIDSDHELFFVMTFEAVIMNEGFLNEKLRNVARNDTWLIDIANNGISPTGITANNLAVSIATEIKYDIADVKEIDMITVNSICAQSFYKRTGIYSMSLPLSGFWFSSRPDYIGRKTSIEMDEFVSDEFFGDCGNATFTPFQHPTALIDFINNMDWK